jgi:hypothetical protein
MRGLADDHRHTHDYHHDAGHRAKNPIQLIVSLPRGIVGKKTLTEIHFHIHYHAIAKNNGTFEPAASQRKANSKAYSLDKPNTMPK